MDQAKFALDLDFKAINQGDGTLRLVGYGSTFTEDRDRETVTLAALKGAVDAFLQNGVLLLQHDPHKVIGRVTKATVDNIGMLVEAEVPPPPEGSEAWHVKAYHDIKRGLLRAFSIGGLFTRVKNAITAMDLGELSVVSIPSNRTSLFAVVQKAFELNLEETAGEPDSQPKQAFDVHALRASLASLNADLDAIVVRMAEYPGADPT